MAKKRKRPAPHPPRTASAAPTAPPGPAAPAPPKPTPPARGRGSAPPREPFEAPLPKRLWWITALAAVLRARGLFNYGLWLDEIYVHDLAKGPWSAALRTSHPIHFMAVKPLVTLWDNEVFLRLPSFIFGVLSVPLGFLAARRLAGAPAALSFAFFLSVGPYFINYSIDANYYSHMMFWALAMMYWQGRLFATRHFLNLAPLAACAGLCFFVHPFSGLFSASMGLFLLIDLVVNPAYFERFAVVRRITRTPQERLGVAVAALAALALVLFGIAWQFRLTGRIKGLMNAFLDKLSLGKSPVNIKFSYEFFEDFFSRIGPSFFYTGPDLTWAAYPVFILFAAGAALSWRRDRVFPLMFALPFVITFGLIFNLDAQRFFSIRYVSYLAPLYWLAAAVAVAEAAQWIESRGRSAAAPLPRAGWIQGGLTALVGLLALPQILHLMTFDGRGWDRVMPLVKERAKPGEPFIHTNWAESTILPYYLNKYGMSDHSSEKLDYHQGREKFTQAQLQDRCFSSPSLWFISTWLEIYSPEALAWVRGRLTPVAEGPSIFAPTNDAAAFHWTAGGRYVLPPRITRHTPPGAPSPANRWRETFVFEEARDYDIQFRFRSLPAARELTALLDGHPAPLSAPPMSDSKTLLIQGRIEQGLRQIELTSSNAPFELEQAIIIPRYPDGKIIIPAAEARAVYPSIFTLTPPLEGGYVLNMKRNTFAAYRFGLAEPGLCWLGLDARHDGKLGAKNAPVLIEVRLNEQIAGVLHYPNGPAAWETRGFPIQLTEGDYDLTLRFLNERSASNKDPVFDREAWARRIELSPASGETASRDDRIFRPLKPALPIPVQNGPPPLRGQPGWQFVTVEGEGVRCEGLNSPEGRPEFLATIPRNAQGVMAYSPTQPVPPSRLVYHSSLLKTVNLKNHSANMRTHFYGPDYQELDEMVVNQEGITGSTDWVRFADFRPAPAGAAYYQAVLWVYPNGARPSPDPGEIRFTGLQIENQD